MNVIEVLSTSAVSCLWASLEACKWSFSSSFSITFWKHKKVLIIFSADFPQETDPLPDFPGTATLLQCSPMACQVNFCLLWALAHTCCTDTCAHTDTLSAFPYFFEFMLKINNLGQKGWDLFLVANHLLTLLWQLLCYPGNLSICLPYKIQKELSQDLLPKKKTRPN